MQINVTKYHIKNGQQGNSRCCAIALAMKSAGFPSVEVGTDHIWPFEGAEVKVVMPLAVQCRRSEFDCGWTIQPFSFELDLEAARVD